MSIERFDRAAWPFFLALVIAAIMRLAFPFDGLYGQDAFAYFRFARAIWPHFLHGASLPDLYWPRGYPAAVALLLPMVGGGLAGQIVSALACAWAAAATFLFVQELERRRGDAADPTARLVAGICVAASGVVLRNSQVVMADGLALGLAAAALWCAARYLRSRSGQWLVPCAVALAWGAVTRWQVGLLAIPIGTGLAIARFERSHPATIPTSGGPNILRAWWLAATLAGLLVLVPQLIVAHGVPHSLEQHEWLERWNLLNGLRRDFHTTEGHTHYHFPVGLFYLVRLGWPDALFPTIAILAVVGAWLIVRERRAVEIALLVGWPLVNWVFISGIPYENPRFIWPTLPAIAALVGMGFRTIRDHLGERARARFLLFFVSSMVLGLALGAREHAHTVTRKNADRALVAWIDAQVPAGTTLLRSDGTLMSEYYGSTRVRDLYGLTPDDLGGLIARDCPCFYLENRDEIEGQWAGLPPQALFAALRRDPGLTAVATLPPRTMFRVGPAR